MSGDCCLISCVACSPVMRGIETSSTATSGLCCDRLLERVDAVLGFGDHLHVGLAVEQQPARRSARSRGRRRSGSSRGLRRHRRSVAARSTGAPAGTSSLTVVPLPGRESISSVPPTSSARSRMPDRPRPLPSSANAKPDAVVGDLQRGRASRSGSRLTSMRVGARVAGGVHERLLRDPVDHHLRRRGTARRGGGRPRSCARAGPRRSKSRTCVRSAATRPWSSSAVGRSWRARSSSSPIAWSASCFVSASWACSSRRARPGPRPRCAAAAR